MPVDAPTLTAERDNDGLDFVSVLRDCLSCAVITVSERRTVNSFNPRAEQLTGLKAERVLGNDFKLLPEPIQQIINETFSNGQPASERRLILHDQKRGALAIQVSATPTRSPTGIFSGVVVVLNDISSVRKWESNMRRLDRLHSVGTLSASMAHEVKNAFVAVRTFVDLLLEKNQEADLAEIVRLEMNRIDSIIGQMLKFSGPAKPTFASVHLHFVLNKSLLLIRHLLEDKKIKLTRMFNASPDLIEGDQDQLEQALLNLLFNAFDALGENGKLEVSTELLPGDAKIDGLPPVKAKHLIRLVIRDNGIGIPAENMERLFEPFFTTKPECTGLGLAITRRIIQEHHGVIAVNSEPGKGTSFSIILPALDAAT
jgi:two-component system nitrogen regulation sensor histidine kinase GlnL